MNPIPLAGCVITDKKGNILLLHRNTPQLIQWELPGGKIEQGETASTAAKREVREELGIEVTIGKYLGSGEFTDAGTKFHYSWYIAAIVNGKPTVMEPHKFDGVRYVPVGGIRKNPAIFSVNVHNYLSHSEADLDYNQQTLQTYEEHVKQYVNKTPHKASTHVTDWIGRALKRISTNGSILEIGSAFGRDADYIESKGFTVQRSDAAKSFVTLLRNNGKQAIVLNALTDDLGGPYNMIFANAVFLHFKPVELSRVLQKIHDSLHPDGILAFAVKKGTGSGWKVDKMDGPRFFQYWQADDLKRLVVEAGFESIELSEGTSRNAEWIHVIAKKPS